MNLKISLFTVFLMAMSVCAEAQSARNPLNHEPAQVKLQKRASAWQLSEEIFYHADGKPFDKRNFVYDENGRKSSEISYQWNEIEHNWQQTMQCAYQFVCGKEVVISESDRQLKSKTETLFDIGGHPAYSVSCHWNRLTDDWSSHPSLRNEWVYDSKGVVTTCLKQHINMETNEWNDFDARILYMYDETGALTEELFQSWKPETKQWINKGKYMYKNVSEQQKIATSYIYVSDKWVSDGKTVYLYDNEGNLTRCDYFNKDTDETLHAYSINTYTESVYFPKLVESDEINIFPNPAISFFVLTVLEEYVGKTMQIFDTWGKQVKSELVKNPTSQVDVSGLTTGFYMLKIGDLSKKVIIGN